MNGNEELTVDELFGEFIVISRNDMRKYLNQHDRETLEYLLGRLARAKEKAGEKPDKYIVVSQADDYADQVIELVLTGEKVKDKCEH